MAAILCKSVGKMCSALCTGISKVLNLPCKCGSETFKILCQGDFCLYKTCAYATGIPPVVFTVLAITYEGGKCIGGDSLYTWLYVNALLCLVNMIGSVYISNQIESPVPHPTPSSPSPEGVSVAVGGTGDIPIAQAVVIENREGQTSTNKGTSKAKTPKMSGLQKLFSPQPRPIPSAPPLDHAPMNQAIIHENISSTNNDEIPSAGSLNRVKHVLCDDPWVALYILLFMVFVVWQFVGIGRLFGNNFSDCSNYGQDQIRSSLFCGFLFLTLGFFLFLFSLCCSTSRRNCKRN